jgi:hypothetical protein
MEDTSRTVIDLGGVWSYRTLDGKAIADNSAGFRVVEAPVGTGRDIST